jgi:hypothetical protein
MQQAQICIPYTRLSLYSFEMVARFSHPLHMQPPAFSQKKGIIILHLQDLLVNPTRAKLSSRLIILHIKIATMRAYTGT